MAQYLVVTHTKLYAHVHYVEANSAPAAEAEVSLVDDEYVSFVIPVPEESYNKNDHHIMVSIYTGSPVVD